MHDRTLLYSVRPEPDDPILSKCEHRQTGAFIARVALMRGRKGFLMPRKNVRASCDPPHPHKLMHGS
jgi:hypothetical protein